MRRRFVASAKTSAARRLLVPASLVLSAACLGLLVWWPSSASANGASPLPGVVLTAATSSNAKSSNLSAQLAEGKVLFDENCSSCHGIDAQGSALAPNLHGVGAGTVDLWVSSGWMPLAVPTQQPLRKPAKFSNAQTVAIAEYVSSLAGFKGIAIPKVDLNGASVAEGFSLFAQNCAACHTVTGSGDALANGASAPSLHDVTKTQVWEAVRTGPSNMPRFGSGILSNTQVRDLDAYVTEYIEHPRNPGGLGLGGVGPVAEGFIGLFVGVGLCMLAALWIGDRTQREPAVAGGHGDGGHGTGGTPSAPDAGHPTTTQTDTEAASGQSGSSTRESEHA